MACEPTRQTIGRKTTPTKYMFMGTYGDSQTIASKFIPKQPLQLHIPRVQSLNTAARLQRSRHHNQLQILRRRPRQILHRCQQQRQPLSQRRCQQQRQPLSQRRPPSPQLRRKSHAAVGRHLAGATAGIAQQPVERLVVAHVAKTIVVTMTLQSLVALVAMGAGTTASVAATIIRPLILSTNHSAYHAPTTTCPTMLSVRCQQQRQPLSQRRQTASKIAHHWNLLLTSRIFMIFQEGNYISWSHIATKGKISETTHQSAWSTSR
jgi:hypothetical protein